MNVETELLQSAGIQLTFENPSVEYRPLLEAIGDAQLVLIGDASHGTKEFYRERAEITKLLVEQKGFNVVCVEGDWPDCATVNRYIHGKSQCATADEGLVDFTRFPTWMWRNEVMVSFLGWMREWNDKHPGKLDFYGLDVYSLQRSSKAVISYLESVSDKKAADFAKCMYSCFDKFNEDPVLYSLSIRVGLDKGCREEAARVLRKLLQESMNDRQSGEEKFVAEMNALVVKDAEEYYRCMLDEDINSWNIRDTHMTETLQRLMNHITKRDGQTAKVVVWAHNSHVGDARETDMGKRRGEINIGQLARERFGHLGVFNIGCLGHAGSVTAAHEWDTPGIKMSVNPSRSDSVEHLLHRAFPDQNALLLFSAKTINEAVNRLLGEARLERFIGVVYKPDTELWSHYSASCLSKQFDAVLFMDYTTAISPLGNLREP